MALFAGIKLVLEGTDYIIPPISLGQLRNGVLTKLKEHDVLVADGKPYEAMILRGEIIVEAAQRNYPDFDEDLFYKNVDVATIGDLWLAVLGLSGFTPGEDQAAVAIASGT